MKRVRYGYVLVGMILAAIVFPAGCDVSPGSGYGLHEKIILDKTRKSSTSASGSEITKTVPESNTASQPQTNDEEPVLSDPVIPDELSDVLDAEPPADTPDPVVPVEPGKSVAQLIAEVGALPSLLEREVRLQRLASGPLDKQTQVLLVDAVFDDLLSDSAKEKTLILLIRNRAFNWAGRDAVTRRLDGFTNSGSRQRIEAMLR